MSTRPAPRSRASGSSRRPSARSTTIEGTATRKTEPHQKWRRRMPATTGASTPPSAKLAVQTPTAVVRWRGSYEHDADQGQGRRHERGSRNAEEGPRRDQHRRAGRERRQQGGQAEGAGADQQHPAAADTVSERPHRHQRAGDEERIAVDDPQQLGVRRPEVRRQLRDREVQHVRVHRDQQARQRQQGEPGPFPGARSLILVTCRTGSHHVTSMSGRNETPNADGQCVTLKGWRSRSSRCPRRCWSTSSTAGEPSRGRRPLLATARLSRRSSNGTASRARGSPTPPSSGSRTQLYPVFAAGGAAERARLVTDLMTSCPDLTCARRRRRPHPTRVARAASARRDPGRRHRHAAHPARRARPRAPGHLRFCPLRRRLRGRVAGRASALLLRHVPEPRARRSLPARRRSGT